jgi:hypothetical protein
MQLYPVQSPGSTSSKKSNRLQTAELGEHTHLSSRHVMSWLVLIGIALKLLLSAYRPPIYILYGCTEYPPTKSTTRPQGPAFRSPRPYRLYFRAGEESSSPGEAGRELVRTGGLVSYMPLHFTPLQAPKK